MGVAGFGKVAVNDTFEATYPFGRDLEGRFLYLRDGEEQWLLGAFDFSYRFRRTCRRWREAISEATGIPVSHIWTHDLQNHSAPTAIHLVGEPCEKLIAKCVPAIQETIANAQEAELSCAIADLGTDWNLCREQYIPGLGAVTVWAGLEFDEDGRPYSQDPDIMLLAGWKPDLPAFKDRIYFDRPADPQGGLLAFRSKATGQVLGSLARFSAHVDIVGSATGLRGGMDEYHYHPDWPGDLREAVESELGGIGIAVCGPCGNLSTKRRWLEGYEGGTTESLRIGSGVASACLDAFREESTAWEPVRLGESAGAAVDLPMRDSIPADRDALRAHEDRANEYRQAFEAAIQAGKPAFEIKQLIDEHYHWSCMKKICDNWAGLSDEEMRRRVMTVELEALRLNDLVLAGLPGESLTETCAWLKAQSIGDRLLVFDQINGYCIYMTTPEQYDLGGYSYWCSTLARNAEPLMRRSALRVIRSAWGG